MTIERIGGTTTVPVENDEPSAAAEGYVPMGTAEDLLATVANMLDEQRSDERSARRAAQEGRRQAAEARIGAKRSAAGLRLAGAVVQGTATAASGAAKGAGAVGVSESVSGSASDYASGTGKGVGGLLEGVAAFNEADADAHGVSEQRHNDIAEAASDHMSESRQRQEKALEVLEGVLQAEIAQTRAAIRG